MRNVHNMACAACDVFHEFEDHVRMQQYDCSTSCNVSVYSWYVSFIVQMHINACKFSDTKVNVWCVIWWQFVFVKMLLHWNDCVNTVVGSRCLEFS